MNPFIVGLALLFGISLLEKKKKKVFVSFDYDHDRFLKAALAGQAKNKRTNFEIIDRSVKYHLNGHWQSKVRGRIDRADIVIIICGTKTHLAEGVAEELLITKKLGKSYRFLKGYQNKNCTFPKGASSEDVMHDWTWENLESFF